jgi:hypothetical protein
MIAKGVIAVKALVEIFAMREKWSRGTMENGSSEYLNR